MGKTEKITSRDNKRVKLARRVRDGKSPDLIFVEGVRLAEEALRSRLPVLECFVTRKFEKTERGSVLRAAVAADGVSICELPTDIFNSIADTEQPQGIILICERPGTSRSDLEARFRLDPAEPPVVLLLHQTNNPSNLGAIFRTAEAAGVAAIIVSVNSSDVFSPKALRGAMGSSLRLPVWTGAGYQEALNWASNRRMVTTAADICGGIKYTDINWSVPRLLVFGSEASGLDQPHLERVDEKIFIPMANDVESLNLAVSCGVILFEARRAVTAGPIA